MSHAGPLPPPPPGNWSPQGGYTTMARAGNGQAVAALVLGCTCVVFCWLGLLALAQDILAIVFGAIGLNNASHGGGRKGAAIAGLVLGIFGLIFYLLVGLVTWGVGWVI